VCGNYNGNKNDDAGDKWAYKATGVENLWNYPWISFPITYEEQVFTGKTCPAIGEEPEQEGDDITTVVCEAGDDDNGEVEVPEDELEEEDDEVWIDDDFEQEAIEKCNMYAEECAAQGYDFAADVAACLYDVRVTSDLTFAATSLEVMRDECGGNDDVLECPNMCNFQGTCTNGVCECNDGFVGESCDEPILSKCVHSVTPSVVKAGDTIRLTVSGYREGDTASCAFVSTGEFVTGTFDYAGQLTCIVPELSVAVETVRVTGSGVFTDGCEVTIENTRKDFINELNICDTMRGEGFYFYCYDSTCFRTGDYGENYDVMLGITNLIGVKADGTLYALQGAEVVRSYDKGGTFAPATEFTTAFAASLPVLSITTLGSEPTPSLLNACNNPISEPKPVVIMTHTSALYCVIGTQKLCLIYTADGHHCEWKQLPITRLLGRSVDGWVYGQTRQGHYVRSKEGDDWEAASSFDPGHMSALNHYDIQGHHIDGPVECFNGMCTLNDLVFTFTTAAIEVTEIGTRKVCQRPWYTCSAEFCMEMQ
jgi:hypothetical protein